MAGISRLNIFTIGFLVLLAVFTYWVVPNLILYIGQVGMDTIMRYKWFFLAVALIILGIMLWIVYLRYSESALLPNGPEVASAPSEMSGNAVEKIGKPEKPQSA